MKKIHCILIVLIVLVLLADAWLLRSWLSARDGAEAPAQEQEELDRETETKEEEAFTVTVTDAYFGLLPDNYTAGDTYCYHIPQINLRDDRASAVNSQIYDELYALIGADTAGDSDLASYSAMAYTWGQRGDLLSVVTETQWAGWAWTEYYVYTVSAETGEYVSEEALLAAYGMDAESFRTRAAEVLTKAYESYSEETIALIGEDSFRTLIFNTVSDGNLDKAKPYVGADGHLCIAVCLYGAAGAEYYWNLFDLETGEKLAYITCTEDHTEQPEPLSDSRQADYSGVISQYETALKTDFTDCGSYVSDDMTGLTGWGAVYEVYYAVCDLNRDGTPELVIGAVDTANDSDGEIVLYSIFTHDGNEPVLLVGNGSFGYRASMKLFADGTIKVTGSGGASTYAVSFLSLPAGSCELALDMEYGTIMGEPYRIDADGIETVISQEELDALATEEDPAGMTVPWLRISAE